jgi:hypothetical protein
MSATSVSGLDGVSRKNMRVLGRTALDQASIAWPLTNVVSMPKRASTPPNSCTVEPKTALEQTTWSPCFSNAIAVARIADMPEAVATQASAPSSAASRVCSIDTVGLLKRE